MAAPSARGLFRATGKTAKPVMTDLINGEAIYADKIHREERDFYPTPAEPTRALLHAEADRLMEFPAIWESAAGDGAMAKEIEAIGLPVFKTDLVDRGCGADLRDYFSISERPCDAMITNPPYSEINARDGNGRWLTHAMDIGCTYVALFLNWGWPAAKGLTPVLERFPISRVYLCRWKVDFTGKGSPPMHNAWFVWDADWTGETAFRFLDKSDARQGEFKL